MVQLVAKKGGFAVLLRRHLPQIIAVLFSLFIRRVYQYVKQRRSETLARSLFESRVELYEMQACILSTENLARGRIEKRTLFTQPLKKMFPNSYLLENVLEAASRTDTDNPILPEFLNHDDKWHVLNTVLNHVSCLYAPDHVFFNEAKRDSGNYTSSWYAVTVTCNHASTSAAAARGSNESEEQSRATVRIRTILVNEQELRGIANGTIEMPEEGLMSARHTLRWGILERFAELFEQQLSSLSGSGTGDWGPNLCGRLKAPTVLADSACAIRPRAGAAGSAATRELTARDNCFLRIHIPFPGKMKAGEPVKTRDVVLYE